MKLTFAGPLLAVLTSILLFAQGSVHAQTQHPADCVLAAYYPPFMITDTGADAGMSIDVLREAARRAGRTLDIQFMPFQRLLLTLDSGSGCITPALFQNDTREGKYRWIVTYDAAQLRFLTMGDPVNSLDEGRTLQSIAVETGASADQFLTSVGFDNLLRLSGPASSARMLHAGRVSAWTQTQTVGSGLWKDLNLSPALQFGTPIYSVPVYVAGGLDLSDDVVQAYDSAVTEMLQDGTVARILSRYK